MIHWCFALNKLNYARYLPVYYAQMSRLQETSPVLHNHFLNGGFSVQLRNEHPFARIAVNHRGNGQQRYAYGSRDPWLQYQTWCGVPLLSNS